MPQWKEWICDDDDDDADVDGHRITFPLLKRVVWSGLVSPIDQQLFFSFGLRDWLLMGLHGKYAFSCAFRSSIMYGMALWLVWKWRNEWIFFESAAVEDFVKISVDADACSSGGLCAVEGVALELGIQRVVLESDHQDVVDVLNNVSSS
ncbi:hypothetical protein Tsubulata_021870 [Turnera subulata]|uniref:RNase H type-1 domain-containing protein n=1 Tax=Turnera subulata TaxID=218843 RepID=A0A9Q0FRY0_9ROSI|nr:hypothetical protein Tsubulata_021870 [Turnera subulata]